MIIELNNCATWALGCQRKKIPWKDFGSKSFSIYPLNCPRILFWSTVFWLSFLIIWGTSFDHSWHFRFISDQLRLTDYQVTTFEVPTQDKEKESRPIRRIKTKKKPQDQEDDSRPRRLLKTKRKIQDQEEDSRGPK